MLIICSSQVSPKYIPSISCTFGSDKKTLPVSLLVLISYIIKYNPESRRPAFGLDAYSVLGFFGIVENHVYKERYRLLRFLKGDLDS